MILNSLSKSVRVVLGEAMTTTECDVIACWGDYTSGSFTPGAFDTATAGTTPVTIAAIPPQGVQRLVNEITVFNKDTVTHQVTLQLLDGATVRVFRQAVVPVGGTLTYAPSGDDGLTALEPAILLESGTVGVKISALPAFNLATPPVGTERLAVVEAGATSAMTLAQAYQINVDWLDFIATNPLDAPAASNATGGVINLRTGAGDGTGDGGKMFLTSSAGGATSGAGGDIQITLGAGGAPNGTGGNLIVSAGGGAGSGIGGGFSVQAGGGDATGAGGDIELTGGDGGATSGNGGGLQLGAGAAQGVGTGGGIVIVAGAGGNTSGDGGVASITAGAASTSGAGGLLQIMSGNGNDTGAGGDLTLTAGAAIGASGSGGNIDLTSGAGPTASGHVFIFSGNQNTTTPTGDIEVITGDQSGSGDTGEADFGTGVTTSGTSGVAFFYTGNSSLGNTGVVTLTSGDAATGNSGDVVVQTGTAGGTRGNVLMPSLPTAAPATSGALWVDAVTHILHVVP